MVHAAAHDLPGHGRSRADSEGAPVCDCRLGTQGICAGMGAGCWPLGSGSCTWHSTSWKRCSRPAQHSHDAAEHEQAVLAAAACPGCGAARLAFACSSNIRAVLLRMLGCSGRCQPELPKPNGTTALWMWRVCCAAIPAPPGRTACPEGLVWQHVEPTTSTALLSLCAWVAGADGEQCGTLAQRRRGSVGSIGWSAMLTTDDACLTGRVSLLLELRCRSAEAM